jgi:hypothetical protein
VLFLTAPSASESSATAWRITPTASPQEVGVTVGKRF